MYFTHIHVHISKCSKKSSSGPISTYGRENGPSLKNYREVIKRSLFVSYFMVPGIKSKINAAAL